MFTREKCLHFSKIMKSKTNNFPCFKRKAVGLLISFLTVTTNVIVNQLSKFCTKKDLILAQGDILTNIVLSLH